MYIKIIVVIILQTSPSIYYQQNQIPTYLRIKYVTTVEVSLKEVQLRLSPRGSETAVRATWWPVGTQTLLISWPSFPNQHTTTLIVHRLLISSTGFNSGCDKELQKNPLLQRGMLFSSGTCIPSAWFLAVRREVFKFFFHNNEKTCKALKLVLVVYHNQVDSTVKFQISPAGAKLQWFRSQWSLRLALVIYIF